MKKFLLILFIAASWFSVSAQMVATMQIKEPIPGLCNDQKVYALMSVLDKDQKEAVCPLSNKEIAKRLNAEVTYVKDSVKFADKGMVSVIINCKGIVVKCDIDNKTKSPELDKQIVAVFKSLGEWKAGKIKTKKVDSVVLIPFEIKDGKFTVDN